MTISIKASNIELTPALKDYAEKRMKGISKFTEGEAEVVVDIGKVTAHHKGGDIFQAAADVVTPLGKQYHAVTQKSDLYEAIDDVRNEIVRSITSAKGKRDTLFIRGARKFKKIIRGLR